MSWVGGLRGHGLSLFLHDDVMRDVLNSEAVRQVLTESAAAARTGIEAHVRATASPEHAENYVAALAVEQTTSDARGFNFSHGLGNRPLVAIGIPSGRGPNPAAKPPLMVEAETHALTSVPGFQVSNPSEVI